MKREIKFRAWDSDNELMSYTGLSFDNIEELRYALDGFEDYFHREYFKKNPEYLMQYTGLPDKNGKEIYFDDLMSNNFKTDKEVIRQVVLYHGTMMLKRVKGKSSLPKYLPLYEWHEMNMVVIGNIHEDKNKNI